MFFLQLISVINMMCFMPKKATAQNAHLVFSNAQKPNPKKPKEHFLANASKKPQQKIK